MRHVHSLLIIVAAASLVGCGRMSTVAAVDPLVYHQPMTLGSAIVLPAASLPARVALVQVAYDCGPREAGAPGPAPVPGPGARLKIVPTPPSIAVPAIKTFAANVTGVRDAFVLQPEMAASPSFADPSALRQAARRYDADLVVAFSTSESWGSKEHLPVLTVLTLGFAPNVTADADAIARATVLDARTGYVYGSFDVTAESWELATAWNKDDAAQQAREQASSKLVEQLLAEAQEHWPQVMAQAKGLPRNAGVIDPPGLISVDDRAVVTPPGLRYRTR